MANGSTDDSKYQGPNILDVLRALSVAPKSPPGTPPVDTSNLSVAPKAPPLPTLDVSTQQPAPATAARQVRQQAPPPEDPTQKLGELMGALLGTGRGDPGMIPQTNIATNRRPSDWILGTIAPLATGLASAMSGPLYRSRRNFIAGLASSAPTAVANLIEAPAQRRVQQAELNQQRFKTAAEIIRGMAPWMRNDQLVVGQDENRNLIYIPRSQAAGVTPGKVAAPKEEWVISPDGMTQTLYRDGKPVIGPDQKLITEPSGAAQKITAARQITPIKQNAQLKPGDFVYNADTKMWGRTEVNQQGQVDHVNWDDGQGHPIVPPPGYLPTNSTTVEVRQVTDADGNTALMAIPVTRTESKQVPKGTAKASAPAGGATQKKTTAGTAQKGAPLNTAGIHTIFTLGQKKTKEDVDAYTSTRTVNAINQAKEILGPKADPSEIATEAKAIVADTMALAAKDPNNPDAKRLLASKDKILASIDRQLGTQKGMTLQFTPGGTDESTPPSQ